jgi:hypothetical protein
VITLVLVSAIYGVVAALVFRRFTNRASIRRSMNRILAHTMELGLFLDSPGLVFRAQRDLLRENARLLRQVILPGAIVALLFSTRRWTRFTDTRPCRPESHRSLRFR